MVRKHPIGADMVEITIAELDYPLDVLKRQSEQIAMNLGSEARGLSVGQSGSDPKFKFAKASFATDGIIDREKGTVRLNSIVQGILGVASKQAIKSFLITLEGEAPVDRQTLQSFASDTVVLRAHASQSPKGIEYRILALTEDATKLDIPDRYVEDVAKPAVKKPVKSEGVSWLPLALVVVAGIAGGALVYFAISGRSARANRRPHQRK